MYILSASIRTKCARNDCTADTFSCFRCAAILVAYIRLAEFSLAPKGYYRLRDNLSVFHFVNAIASSPMRCWMIYILYIYVQFCTCIQCYSAHWWFAVCSIHNWTDTISMNNSIINSVLGIYSYCIFVQLFYSIPEMSSQLILNIGMPSIYELKPECGIICMLFIVQCA